jgi:hypothetical protein
MNKPISPTEAVVSITEPLTRDTAIRHGWLGDTRMGKSVANRILINYVLARKMVQLVLTTDDKTPKESYYPEGYPVATIHEYMMDCNDKGNHIVFRGTAHRRDKNDAVIIGDVGELAWDIVRQAPLQVIVNIDELADATPGQGQAWLQSSEPIAQIFRKGGGAGISAVWTTQLPQTVPLEAFGLSETLGIFRLDGREVDYLYRKRVLGSELVDIVPSLEVGEWVLYRKGRGGWDGNVYKFPYKKEGAR